MFTVGKPNARILVVRLGALGDIIHALPAVASLKHSYPGARLTWIVERKWAPLLEDNPFIDRLALLDRDTPLSLIRSMLDLRSESFDLAIDFQGLIKSALVASAAHPDCIFGFHHTQVRERAAALFYSNKVASQSAHVVDRNLDLAAAAGAANPLHTFPLPAGRPEGELPPGDFVLASPLAGWRSKQWPIEHYRLLAAGLRRDLGIPLVLNLPPGTPPTEVADALPHYSGLPGLIHATRRAVAVVGVDSGPLHIAAALGKPGVAIFGPTDPARNGPYGESLRVLRSPAAATTYKRGSTTDESMRSISPAEVFEILRSVCVAR
ncbi:MAG TPA: glycosyltransferase family 9 protein [Bryobacteraceae bacterium]|jgi:heptosyltransferase-1